MGNPASPILASLVMDYVISKVVSELPFEIPWIKLYVDDTILPVPGNEVERVKDLFNLVQRRIQFTVEMETDSTINVLDVQVFRESNGLLKTNWYQKPTSAGRVINFKSNHPTSQKIGVVFGLLHRAIGLSHEDFHRENLNRVKKVLVNNNYPVKFISKCVNSFQERRDGHTTRVEPDTKRSFRLPLINGLWHRLNRCLKLTDSRFVPYNLRRVGDLYSKLKDPTPPLERAGVINKIPSECQKWYVGQTKQLLGVRIRQHKNDCVPKKQNKDEKTALALHHVSTEHRFIFEATSILDVEQNWRKRNISEMIHISLNTTVNKREDTQHLSSMYNSLLRKFKHQSLGVP
ncbi:uncharacterized protein LOC107045989 [Diachasma alloeum]|uniref:uncharacterized protein LOC107045989 n=1 Tax=Diachasma alloeum TaxID=454923 RepID=UPI0007382053|nr:uncharacterized protein LOC107045989 [Diachasma alloeum]